MDMTHLVNPRAKLLRPLASMLLIAAMCAPAAVAEETPAKADANFPTSDQARSYFAEGVNQYRAGRIKDAAISFRSALALEPDNPTVLWKSARALESIGLSGQALPLAERSIALMPFNAIAHGSHAMTLMHLGRRHEALAAFVEEARLARRAHGQFFILAMRAQAHLMLGEYDLGLKAAEESLRQFADYSYPAVIKATCLAALGREAEAQDAVRACRKLGLDIVTPDNWDKANRRFYSPDGIAQIAPAMTIYRRVWDVTPEEAQ